MRDSEIRQSLVEHFRARKKSQAVLISEVDVRWSVPARLDLLLVSDRIHGIEIKSDFDSLRRLPRQVAAYSAVTERCTVVVGERHTDAAREAVPDWWGVWIARAHGPSLPKVVQVRRGKANPSVDPLAVLTLLTRPQLTGALTKAGFSGLSAASVDELRALLVGSASLASVVSTARHAMLARSDWTSRSLL